MGLPGRLPGMPSVRRPLVLLLAVPALLAGCSATPAPTATPSNPPAITANPTPVSTEATSAPADSPVPAACPSGEYRATGFTATGANSTTGKGTLKEVDVTFRDGRYVFEFDEDDPITLTINKQSGRVRIDGEVRGSYTGTADDLTFTLGDTTGTARFTQGGKTRTVPMTQVAAVLAPQGKGSAVCTGNDLALAAGSVTWELVRDND